jgi:hypothetical protein
VSRGKRSLLHPPPSSPHHSYSLTCHTKRPSSKKGKGGKDDDAEELASQAFRALGAMGSNTGTVLHAARNKANLRMRLSKHFP